MNVREAQLFIDDYVIESYVRVHRTIHQPQKFGPVMLADRPWEGNIIGSATVLRNPETGLYQMWYYAINNFFVPGSSAEANNCYAVSQDGVHWDKPVVGDVEFRGSKENNIVVGRGSLLFAGITGVVFDPEDPNKEQRYKMLIYGATPYPHDSGYLAAFSPDGVHWKVTEDWVDHREGDATYLMHDPAKKKYVNYTRCREMADHRRRVVYRSESSDFMHWTYPELALVPDLADSHDIQFYSMSAFRYESLYIGFLQCMHTKEDRLDIQLVTSRDNRVWRRTEPRQVFLPNGPEGSWDGGVIGVASNPPIIDPSNQRLWIYYTGSSRGHMQRWPFNRTSVGLATLRRDGFASIDAGPTEGILTTKPFVWPGGKLLVNVNAGVAAGIREWKQEAGYTRLEILDEDGKVIPGFSRDECKPWGSMGVHDSLAHFGSLGHEFQWTSGKDLNSLIGEKIKLRFYVVNAELYSFKAFPEEQLQRIDVEGTFRIYGIKCQKKRRYR